MLFIGIDPGVNGGIAALHDDGSCAGVWKMPKTETALFSQLCAFEDHSRCAFLERVHASPQMGVVSAFTFGLGYGALRMGLVAAGIEYADVTPQAWQKALGCRTRGDKNITKRKAIELFPNVGVCHWNADALLIAAYCRQLKLSKSTDEERMRRIYCMTGPNTKLEGQN